MVQRALAIASEMWPSTNSWIKAAIRSGVGITALSLGWDWVGKFALMWAAVGLVSHAEGVFVNHATDKTRLLLGTLLALAAGLTLWAREDHEDENGMG